MAGRYSQGRPHSQWSLLQDHGRREDIRCRGGKAHCTSLNNSMGYISVVGFMLLWTITSHITGVMCLAYVLQTLADCFAMDMDFGGGFGVASCASSSGSSSSVATYQ